MNQTVSPSSAHQSARERVVYLDALRVIAVIAVIAIHVASRDWHDVDPSTSTWRVLNLADSGARWAVPIFVMISGALFLDPARDVPTEKIFKVYIKRLAIAYLIWSAVYLFLNLCACGFEMSSPQALATFIKGPFHLWFLWMIIGLYLITPLLRPITASPSATRYFLILSFFLTFLFPMLKEIWTQVTPLIAYEGLVTIGDGFWSGYGKLKLHLTLGYAAYFVLGYYLSAYEVGKPMRITIYVLGIVALLFIGGFTNWASVHSGTAYDGLYDNLYLSVALEATAVFLFVKHHDFSRISDKARMRIQKLSRCSFGVYLVHLAFREAFIVLTGIHPSQGFTPLTITLFIIGIALASFTVSAILNHIPVARKYLV